MRSLALCALLFCIAAPAQARRHRSAHHAKAARPEDDTALHGDAKAFAGARVRFAAPEDRAELAAGDVHLALEIKGYALGAKDGAPPHLHLIVDNEPALQLDAAGAFKLSGLAPGPHLLRAVLCRPWHEVVKAPGAFALTRFWLGPRLTGKAGKAAEFVAWPDPHKPLLTYVLPVGEAAKDAPELSLEADGEEADHGESAGAGPAGASAEPAAQRDPRARHPALDFYVSFGKLARRANKVRVVLDKRELPLLTEWKPLPLRRAQSRGAHKLSIDLLDRRGTKVRNAVNRTDRAFAVP